MIMPLNSGQNCTQNSARVVGDSGIGGGWRWGWQGGLNRGGRSV